MQLEFYNYEEQVLFRNAETNACEQLTENKKEVIAYMIDRLETKKHWMFLSELTGIAPENRFKRHEASH